MKTFKFLLVLTILCQGCNPDKIDTRKVKKDIDDHKIKKITEGEILSAADSTGTKLTRKIQQEISRKLDSAYAIGGVEAAIPFCNLENIPSRISAEESFQASVSRTSFPSRLMNSNNEPDKAEQQILDAYSYNLEKNLPLFSNIQIEKHDIIFYQPIKLTEQQCLRCHGVPGKDIKPGDYEKILAKYPKPNSTNLKMNDFMGMWSVKFRKTEFIKNLK